ncbi:hypothetical protein RF11_05740 [Thelohanellus kitauei]|uniref:Uncharacterized protein n=1 Tax=Thelohanellus kitauei TaxID=669202 RepID=A0A0C2ND90_THEKT|nr:hypothetical protein RF11_05740 [Thelohanellus kitauei]
MGDEFSKILKNILKSQQEQTEAFIKSQSLPMAKLVDSVAHMVSKITVAPSFESYQPSKEPFPGYKSRLEQHFSACSVIDQGDKKSKILAWLVSETYSILG